MNFDDLRHMTKDDLLAKLGLTTRPTFVESFLPAVGIFSAGVLLGAGIALMLAPKSGAELRAELAEGLETLRHRGTSTDANQTAYASIQPRESQA